MPSAMEVRVLLGLCVVEESRKYVDVTQLAEYRLDKAVVEGSSPSINTSHRDVG